MVPGDGAGAAGPVSRDSSRYPGLLHARPGERSLPGEDAGRYEGRHRGRCLPGMLCPLPHLGAEGIHPRSAGLRRARPDRRDRRRLGSRPIPLVLRPRRSAVRGAEVSRRSRLVLQQGSLRRGKGGLPRRDLGLRRLPGRHAAAHRRQRRQRRARAVGRHAQYRLGSAAGARQCLGRALRRSCRPDPLPDGRARGVGGARVGEGAHVGRPGHARARRRAESQHRRDVRLGAGGHGRGRLVGAAGDPRQGPFQNRPRADARRSCRPGVVGHHRWVRHLLPHPPSCRGLGTREVLDRPGIRPSDGEGELPAAGPPLARGRLGRIHPR